MSTIHLSLEFSGAILPIAGGDDGKPRIPFKPIVEAVGVNWDGQYGRVTRSAYLTSRLGICLGSVPYGGQMREMVLIRIDRVASYLSCINPNCVRGAGNEDSADFLEAKHQEWDRVVEQIKPMLDSLDPEHIRSAGNADSADFLEAKHQEWDNVIHQHEMSFGILAGSGRGNVRNQRLHDYISVCRELRLANDADSRATLKTLADELADQLGLGHISAKREDLQLDLFDKQP